MLLLLYFFIFALLCAALYRYVYIVIGSPYISEINGYAGTDGHGMIFQFFGDWIARRYNEKRRSDLAETRRRYIGLDGSINNNGMQLISEHYGADEDVVNADKFQLLEYAIAALPAPLNPYKAVFLCAACSLFWFSIICIIPALLWLNLPAAYWIVSFLFFPSLVFAFWSWLDRF